MPSGHDILASRAAEYGRRLHNVLGDGACAYRAVSHQLFKHEDQAAHLRSLAANFYEEEHLTHAGVDQTDPTVTPSLLYQAATGADLDTVNSLDDYLTKLRQPHTFAYGSDINALALALKIKITVISTTAALVEYGTGEQVAWIGLDVHAQHYYSCPPLEGNADSNGPSFSQHTSRADIFDVSMEGTDLSIKIEVEDDDEENEDLSFASSANDNPERMPRSKRVGPFDRARAWREEDKEELLRLAQLSRRPNDAFKATRPKEEHDPLRDALRDLRDALLELSAGNEPICLDADPSRRVYAISRVTSNTIGLTSEQIETLTDYLYGQFDSALTKVGVTYEDMRLAIRTGSANDRIWGHPAWIKDYPWLSPLPWLHEVISGATDIVIFNGLTSLSTNPEVLLQVTTALAHNDGILIEVDEDGEPHAYSARLVKETLLLFADFVAKHQLWVGSPDEGGLGPDDDLGGVEEMSGLLRLMTSLGCLTLHSDEQAFVRDVMCAGLWRRHVSILTRLAAGASMGRRSRSARRWFKDTTLTSLLDSLPDQKKRKRRSDRVVRQAERLLPSDVTTMRRDLEDLGDIGPILRCATPPLRWCVACELPRPRTTGFFRDPVCRRCEEKIFRDTEPEEDHQAKLALRRQTCRVCFTKGHKETQCPDTEALARFRAQTRFDSNRCQVCRSATHTTRECKDRAGVENYNRRRIRITEKYRVKVRTSEPEIPVIITTQSLMPLTYVQLTKLSGDHGLPRPSRVLKSTLIKNLVDLAAKNGGRLPRPVKERTPPPPDSKEYFAQMSLQELQALCRKHRLTIEDRNPKRSSGVETLIDRLLNLAETNGGKLPDVGEPTLVTVKMPKGDDEIKQLIASWRQADVLELCKKNNVGAYSGKTYATLAVLAERLLAKMKSNGGVLPVPAQLPADYALRLRNFPEIKRLCALVGISVASTKKDTLIERLAEYAASNGGVDALVAKLDSSKSPSTGREVKRRKV